MFPQGQEADMKVGYVRVSTEEQNTARQEVMIEELGVEKVFIEKVSGKSQHGRNQLEEMLQFVREGMWLLLSPFPASPVIRKIYLRSWSG